MAIKASCPRGVKEAWQRSRQADALGRLGYALSQILAYVDPDPLNSLTQGPPLGQRPAS